MSIVYIRIKELCKKHGITIAKLESELSFGSSSIKKWERTSSPSIDKIGKVASYFNVSVDYLIGRSDIETTLDEFIQDDDIISLQRARENMSPTDKEKMMQMLKIGFDYAFQESLKSQDDKK